MKSRLLVQALVKLLSGIILVSVLLFIPAGTFNYLNAWVFIAVLFIPMFFVGIVLFIKSPTLLKKRLSAKEKQGGQKLTVLFSAIIFIVGFVLAGLNFRNSWWILPDWVMILGSILFVCAYGVWGEVMRENAFLSRTIEIQENQKVVDTGLYKIVRHPMYMASIILFLSMPLILGFLGSFILFLAFIPVFVLRIKGEEKLLEDNLEGYKEYKQKVKYRLIPFIW